MGSGATHVMEKERPESAEPPGAESSGLRFSAVHSCKHTVPQIDPLKAVVPVAGGNHRIR